MSGKTKRKYECELMRYAKQLNRPLQLVVETLKPGYTADELLNAFIEYYPYEWKTICERAELYKEKDQFLKQKGKKARYYPLSPDAYFFSLQKVKYLLSDGYHEKHKQAYSEDTRLKNQESMKHRKESRINKKEKKMDEYTKDMQYVDPGFIDALIYAYHRRDNTINNKMEIFKEIQKYECKKTLNFFWKLNDSEQNDEIRKLAFQHLQKSGHYVKLRKKFKGKKKSYQTATSSFDGTPKALADRLQGDTVQSEKKYDLFISHSSQDRELVRQVIKAANSIGLNCYVDWTADNDFLKRSMVSDYTKEVLKHRMKSSKCLLYLSSRNSRKSDWVSFELDYFENNVCRDIFMIVLDGEDLHNFKRIDISEMNQVIEL